MTSSDIRTRFLNFFKDKGHTVVESDLLVPKKDPTVLFTGAGMNQFKEQFMGKNITYSRATSCQKCFRTGDLDNVGKTPRHHTFFEMLGNFSFGDYFKKEAIAWGWEFMTGVMNVPEEKLWISVYKDDEESYRIWVDDMCISEEKIIKLGAKDNFWPADAPTKGPNGPCGPCSEIFYDRGESLGCGEDGCNVACDCGRFVEVWNLVFTEFERKPDGKLVPLPNKNIDTGMGLERMVSVIQGVQTNFDTDLFTSIIADIQKELADKDRKATSSGLHLIADHIRAATFAIGDGVSPSNEKQGYVVRKLIRRAYLKSGTKGPFLYRLVPKVAEIMKEVYPELKEKAEHISAIVEEEERRFCGTLNAAIPVFEGMISGTKELEGEKIFKLVDTYGLPLEVITEMASSRSISLDIEGFEKSMNGRKEQSRRGSDISCDFIFAPDKFDQAPNPEYSDGMPLEAELVFILKEDAACDEISEGESGEVLISPQSSQFYAEAGGQIGDSGKITKDDAQLNIVSTFDASGRKVYGVHVQSGTFKIGDTVNVELDFEKKANTAKNHTATHLLQSALRNVLGDHVKQSGSFVDDKRLRFDFTHMKKVSDREIAKIEKMVNGWINEAISVSKETKSLAAAREEGALSFFGEKYGDTVRIITIGEESKEFCGGTHVDNTSDIEIVKVVSESSVASGIRRIEAVTGQTSREWLKSSVRTLLEDFRQANGKNAELPEELVGLGVEEIASDKIEINAEIMNLFDEKIKPAFLKAKEQGEKAAKKNQKDAEAGVFNDAKDKMDKILSSSDVFGDVNFVSGIFEDMGIPLLRRAARYLEGKTKSAVILLGGQAEGKAYLICSVTSDLGGEKVDAKELISLIAGEISGSGGGKPAFAQAGGTNPSGLPAALEEAKKIIKKR